ncbi:MAG: carboxypeptidase regulatory-like domain-containing protein, partial [Acidobacteria bacterium]|nr:carboxypeptidase regulatory-like domain-containing protein [Acidobacteriota bacterium]
KIEGRVVDEDEQPLAEVRLAAFPADARVVLPGRRGSEKDLIESAVDGYFAVEDLAEGQRYNLFVRKKGYLHQELLAVTAPTQEPLHIVLEAGSQVRGRVVDGRSEGVPDANVHLVEGGPGLAHQGRMFPRGSGSSWGTTDASGSFVLEGVQAGVYELEAVAHSYQRAEIGPVEVVKGRDVEGLEVTLEKGATLEGRVLASGGRPVIEARIWVEEPETQAFGHRSPAAGDRTDGDGRFRLEGLGTGNHVVRAKHPQLLEGRQEIEIQPGVNRIEIALESGWTVSGKVVDTQDEPIAGAQVGL